ncbi:hypothetical protein NM688_g4764 [Phlebia brevispora]|uniref:Uncharacterized protein n=1 Tax=Phlebia brevispora TaxID=194682 RepID=A0ACC1T1Y0_9APHY|nr:hypothetical protein NM688_g4764 [Phlebia brevispora]
MLRRLQSSRLIARGRAHRYIASLSQVLARRAPVDVHPEVQEALQSHSPVVALETTIVTHGMPHPTNLETALSVEKIVRDQGAIPATIGIIGGRVKIGLQREELEHLASPENDPPATKVSRRDIAATVALKRDGGTTCSATLIFAAMAGIKVFATGGLGGVHRGAMDVSADLYELSRCPVGLVSAGVKSILDIGRTMEYLETLGVPVVSYAPTYDFPAFYSRRSGFMSPWRVDDPVSAANILYTQAQFGLNNGAIFGVPIPEQFEAAGETLQQAVEIAVREAEEQGVSKWGKAATPWLLNRVGELSGGQSLESNVALIQNTARVGGQIAVAYAELSKKGGLPVPGDGAKPTVAAMPQTLETPDVTAQGLAEPQDVTGKLMVIGSAAADITARASLSDKSMLKNSTVPGTLSMSLGGVGRNVAEAAHRILSGSLPQSTGETILVAPVGDDLFGRLVIEGTEKLGMRSDGIVRVDGARSAVCNMVLDSQGDLIGGVADMDITHSFDPTLATNAIKKFRPKLVAVDGNLSEDVLSAVVRVCYGSGIPVFFEPTSVVKSTRIWPAVKKTIGSASHSPIAFASPNVLELTQMYMAARAEPLELTSDQRWWTVVDNMALGSHFRLELEHLAKMSSQEQGKTQNSLSYLLDKGIAQMTVNLLPFIQHIIVKCGELGIFTVFRIPASLAKVSPWTNEGSNVKARQVIAHGKDGEVVVVKHFPALTVPEGTPLNVTGAGDSLVGSILASLIQSPAAFYDPVTLDSLIERAQKAAMLTLSNPEAVSPALSSL